MRAGAPLSEQIGACVAADSASLVPCSTPSRSGGLSMGPPPSRLLRWRPGGPRCATAPVSALPSPLRSSGLASGPVLEIECIPKLVIIVSHCIPGF